MVNWRIGTIVRLFRIVVLLLNADEADIMAVGKLVRILRPDDWQRSERLRGLLDLISTAQARMNKVHETSALQLPEDVTECPLCGTSIEE